MEKKVLFLLCCRLQIIFVISFLQTEILFSSVATLLVCFLDISYLNSDCLQGLTTAMNNACNHYSELPTIQLGSCHPLVWKPWNAPQTKFVSLSLTFTVFLNFVIATCILYMFFLILHPMAQPHNSVYLTN